MNSDNLLATIAVLIKSMAFDYISKNNEHMTVEAEAAICDFVGETTKRMVNSKENGENGGREVD